LQQALLLQRVLKLIFKNKTSWLEVPIANSQFHGKQTYIETTWQKLSAATLQLQVTLFTTSCNLWPGGVGVAQLGLLLHGSMSKFQSFLPSDSAISLRAFSKYTIESYQLSTEIFLFYKHVIKYIYTISISAKNKYMIFKLTGNLR